MYEKVEEENVEYPQKRNKKRETMENVYLLKLNRSIYFFFIFVSCQHFSTPYYFTFNLLSTQNNQPPIQCEFCYIFLKEWETKLCQECAISKRMKHVLEPQGLYLLGYIKNILYERQRRELTCFVI